MRPNVLVITSNKQGNFDNYLDSDPFKQLSMRANSAKKVTKREELVSKVINMQDIALPESD